MKKNYSNIKCYLKLFTIILFAVSTFKADVFAGVGDTIIVQAHNNVHMDWHGDFDAMAVFPPDSMRFSKILMKYTLGCASTGCAAYDYTTQVFARVPMGKMDSTLITYPSFSVNGSSSDSVVYNTGTVYTYFFNSTTMTTDSSVAVQFQINLFQDTVNPGMVTDSILVFPGNFYNYIYNNSGAIIDSLYVPYSTVLNATYTYLYTAPFQVLDLIEMGRVMTPYGNSLAATWKNDYVFDVTDYKPVLHDSVPMRIFFDGWADGYNVSVTFYMIEGTPPRDASRVRILYTDKYYEYGIVTNPIESYLTVKKFDLTANETGALLRVTPSGHSFGGAQNCAEFCNKRYFVLVDSVLRHTQNVWRNDCGLNPIFPQAGTWLYDRANWCPGSQALVKEHELTSYITPGDSVSVEMNFDPYTYNGGAGFNPGYILSANLITFGNPNFTLDATVEQIVSPNKDLNYARFNPICNNPIIVIRNTGSSALTSCTITYGIKGGVQQTYNWIGNLPFLASQTVQLSGITWGSSTGTPDIFEALVSNPNGGVDQYAYNDTMRSVLAFTPQYPAQMVFFLKTNTPAAETTWELTDDQGVIIYQNGILAPNIQYYDTLNLAPGCYQLKIKDSAKNGLSFAAGGNPGGIGYARLLYPNGNILKIIESNFGTEVTQRFTVGFTTGVQETTTDSPIMKLHPNPAQDNVTVDLILSAPGDVTLFLTTIDGRVISQNNYQNVFQQSISIDLSQQPSGMYFVTMQTQRERVTRKLLKQ